MLNEQPTASGDASRTNEFISLFTRYQREIYCYIRSLVPCPSDLDEIVQLTSTALWEKYHTFQPGTNFRAWALTMARFTVLTYREKQSRSTLSFSNEFFDEFAANVTNYAELMAVRLEALEECRKALPPSDRDLLDRRYKPSATSQSVANALGRPVVTVYRALSRIRKRLFHCIEWRIAEKELL